MNFYIQSLTHEILGSTIDFMPQFFTGIGIFLVFFLLYIITGKILTRFTKSSDNPNILIFLKKIIRSALIIFGLITMLGTWGINITALIAGLGLTGVAISLALKDSISNAISGIIVIIYSPFKTNDTISICDVTGKVTSIDLRYTTIESQNQKHLIPNSKFFTEKITII